MNPNFDECFEFSVTLEQCLSEGAMIAFTVMDHDVLTANDFAGEAFLALGNIPGVADYCTSVENFHGLKQVDLPLMQQNDKSNKTNPFSGKIYLFIHTCIILQTIQFYKFWNHALAISKPSISYVNKRLGYHPNWTQYTQGRQPYQHYKNI